MYYNKQQAKTSTLNSLILKFMFITAWTSFFKFKSILPLVDTKAKLNNFFCVCKALFCLLLLMTSTSEYSFENKERKIT